MSDFWKVDVWLVAGGCVDWQVHSRDGLVSAMEARGFELIHESQSPLLIREHQRKYQFVFVSPLCRNLSLMYVT
jgi:hypothetical protein